MVSKKTISLIENQNLDANSVSHLEIPYTDSNIQPISSNYIEPQVQSDTAPADSFLNLLINPYGGGC